MTAPSVARIQNAALTLNVPVGPSEAVKLQSAACFLVPSEMSLNDVADHVRWELCTTYGHARNLARVLLEAMLS